MAINLTDIRKKNWTILFQLMLWKDARLKVYFLNNLEPESNPNETRCGLVRMDNVIHNKKKKRKTKKQKKDFMITRQCLMNPRWLSPFMNHNQKSIHCSSQSGCENLLKSFRTHKKIKTLPRGQVQGKRSEKLFSFLFAQINYIFI